MKIFFFIFLLCNTLAAKLHGNVSPEKKIFQQGIFVNKTFNFHSFNKFNDVVTTQQTTAIFSPFYKHR